MQIQTYKKINKELQQTASKFTIKILKKCLKSLKKQAHLNHFINGSDRFIISARNRPSNGRSLAPPTRRKRQLCLGHQAQASHQDKKCQELVHIGVWNLKARLRHKAVWWLGKPSRVFIRRLGSRGNFNLFVISLTTHGQVVN